MLPIVFDVKTGLIVLVGEGQLVERRLDVLDEAGAQVRVYSLDPSDELIEQAGNRLSRQKPTDRQIAAATLVFGAGLSGDAGAQLADRARQKGVLVNIEDVKAQCDFHVPSIVRRGDLTLTVSTGGKSPGLAKRLRQHIEQVFGAEWAGRLDDIAKLRDGWRADGVAMKDISEKTDGYIDQQGWLS